MRTVTPRGTGASRVDAEPDRTHATRRARARQASCGGEDDCADMGSMA